MLDKCDLQQIGLLLDDKFDPIIYKLSSIERDLMVINKMFDKIAER